MVLKKTFSPEELKVVDVKPGFMGMGPGVPLLNTPISYRDNLNAIYTTKDGLWVASFQESSGVMSKLYNDNFSRPGPDNDGMVDVFGAKWKWVASAGGSITAGGAPIFTDANDWKEKITIPDVDSWDWETDLVESNKNLDLRFSPQFTLINGFWFERLITLMDFENAAMALVDEDQQDAVIELFGELTNVACKIVDKVCQYVPAVDGFCVHDDWGSQRSPFFSEEIARKIFLPFMKQLVDHVHSKGRYITIHSCGHIEDRINILLEAGLDGWQMQNMNDVKKLHELYGDKIVFEAWPDEFDPEDEEAAKKAARDFVDHFFKPGKQAIIGYNGGAALSCKAFADELYTYARTK